MQQHEILNYDYHGCNIRSFVDSDGEEWFSATDFTEALRQNFIDKTVN